MVLWKGLKIEKITALKLRRNFRLGRNIRDNDRNFYTVLFEQAGYRRVKRFQSDSENFRTVPGNSRIIYQDAPGLLRGSLGIVFSKTTILTVSTSVSNFQDAIIFNVVLRTIVRTRDTYNTKNTKSATWSVMTLVLETDPVSRRRETSSAAFWSDFVRVRVSTVRTEPSTKGSPKRFRSRLMFAARQK